MRTIGRTLVLVGVVALAAVTWAQAPAGGGMRHPMGQEPGRGMGSMQHGPGGPMAMLAQLNLSEQQTQDIHKVMADAMPQQQADMQQMQKLHEQLKTQLFVDSGPTGDPNALAQEVNALQGKMIQAHIALAQKISGILTPAQRKQVREMPMGDLMGMGGPGPMGRGGPAKK